MTGYFAIGIYEGKTKENVGTLWRSAFLFGAAYIFTIGKRFPQQPSDTPKTERNIPYFEYKDMDEFINAIPRGSDIVFIEQNERSRPLNQANHPDQALYILGAEDYGIPEGIMKGHQIIEIPYQKKISMNVSTAGSIVMYDRYIRKQ